MNEIREPIQGEKPQSFMLRVGDACVSGDIHWVDAASILNAANGVSYDESTWRKKYKTFREGMEYAHMMASSDVYTNILALSDFHIPYMLPVDIFRKYSGCVDVLVLNGDIFDCHSISSFTNAFHIDLTDEMESGRSYIIDLIQLLHPKKVLVTYGNHEARLMAYLSKHIDPGVAQLLPKTVLDYVFTDGFFKYDRRKCAKTWYEPIVKVFPDIDISYVGDWKVKVGRCWLVHPSSYNSPILKTTERAAQYLNTVDTAGFDTVVMAHTHKVGYTRLGNIDCYEQGALCDVTQMTYRDGTLGMPQKEGYLYIAQDIYGKNIREKTKIESLN